MLKKYFVNLCHHLSDNHIDLLDLYVDLLVFYVDLSNKISSQPVSKYLINAPNCY